jgi:uncharacterized protein YdaU (DUF1376 family)
MRYDWYKFYPARYKAATIDLTLEQDGAYRRLIDHYMETGHPLPPSMTGLARICGVGVDQMEVLFKTLSPHLKPDADGSLHITLCDELLAEQEHSHQFRHNNGKRGGRPPKPKNNLEVNSSLPENNLTPKQNRIEQNRIEEDQDKIDQLSRRECNAHAEEIIKPDIPVENKKPPRKPKAEIASAKQSAPTLLTEYIKSYGPANGSLPTNWAEYAKKKYGWSDATIGHIAQRFYRYWTGADARDGGKKRDWDRAWANWCDTDLRTARDFIQPNEGSVGGQKGSYSGAVAHSSKSAIEMLDAGKQQPKDVYPDNPVEGLEPTATGLVEQA